MGFAIGGAILGGAVIGGMASSSASGEQAAASEEAAQIQGEEWDMANAQEQPWIKAGGNALGQIQNNMASYNTPFQPTMQQLESQPGYQFQLQQGEGAVQNSAAAQGHLVSSQEMGNATNYAEGLASTGYQQAFNNYQTQISQSYNRLASLANLGQTASGQSMASGVQSAANVGNSLQSAGAAQAAGTMGMANAVTGAVGQGTNAYMGYQTLNTLNNMGGNNIQNQYTEGLTEPQWDELLN